MNSLKNNISGIIVCMFEILAGILLIINPVAFTTGIITAAGMIMLIIGLISIVTYFKSDIMEAATGRYLMKGIVALLAGAFCIFNSHWFIVTFPVLTIIYGVVVLIAGIGKIQITVDMIRLKNRKWFLGLVSALISIMCAIVILNNPFASVAALWMFTGIVLIAEAVMDVVTIIISGGNKVK